jgi:hypothetical protein
MKTLSILALALLLPAVAFGRIRPVWTYERMRNDADLVIIARPTSSNVTAEKKVFPNISPATNVVGIETKLQIRLVVKGKPATKQVILHHYALAKVADGKVRGAPQLISFDPSQRMCYLMFLKREGDGRYSPVTGQTDPSEECIIKLASSAE